VVGFGIYEYSLDDGPFQSSNVFEYVSLGEHIIIVRDVKEADAQMVNLDWKNVKERLA
jgi:hypothetical protein